MKTPIGIDAHTGEIRLISDVERGLACNCICPSPACAAKLIARKGDERTHHFAHYEAAPDSGCSESALHLMAKHLILNAPSLKLPSVTVSSTTFQTRLLQPVQVHVEYFKEPCLLSDSQTEVRMDNGNIRPDILCKATDRTLSFDLIVEVAVTHKVDEEKRQRIQSLDICAIELDLSDLTTLEELSFQAVEAALSEPFRISWLHRSTRVTDAHKQNTEERVKARHLEREAKITCWERAFADYLYQKGFLNLPLYTLTTDITEPHIRNINNKQVPVALPPPPQIEKQFGVGSVGPVEQSVIQINLMMNGGTFPLPICIDTPSGSIPGKPDGSFLILKVDSLPMPHQIEALLFWGRSRRMEQYERKVKEIKKHKKLEADTPIIRDIEKRVALLRDIQRGDAMPRFPNLKRIEANYLAARQDMLSKGLTPERCLKKIPDGWVMGCPNDYWQTLVL